MGLTTATGASCPREHPARGLPARESGERACSRAPRQRVLPLVSCYRSPALSASPRDGLGHVVGPEVELGLVRVRVRARCPRRDSGINSATAAQTWRARAPPFELALTARGGCETGGCGPPAREASRGLVGLAAPPRVRRRAAWELSGDLRRARTSRRARPEGAGLVKLQRRRASACPHAAPARVLVPRQRVFPMPPPPRPRSAIPSAPAPKTPGLPPRLTPPDARRRGRPARPSGASRAGGPHPPVSHPPGPLNAQPSAIASPPAVPDPPFRASACTQPWDPAAPPPGD